MGLLLNSQLINQEKVLMGSEKLKLFVVLLGARESGYLFEQHKYFFCIASGFEEVKTKAREFWSEAKHLHIDAYICVERIMSYCIIVSNNDQLKNGFGLLSKKLFFVNLGGYYKDSFSEIHKQIFVVATGMVQAKAMAKQDPFFKDKNLLQNHHCKPHVDDIVCVNDCDLGGYSLVLEEIGNTFPIKESEVVITGFMRI